MTSVPKPNPNLIWRIVDGEAILLDTATGFHFSLDPVGTEIWESLQASESIDEIAMRLSQKYSVDANVVRADVIEFVNELQSARLWT